MAQCPKCRAPIIAGDQYCGACGEVLSPSGSPAGAAPPGSRFGGGSGFPPPPPLPMAAPGRATMTAPVATLPPVPDPFLPSQPPRSRRRFPWLKVIVAAVVVMLVAAAGLVFVTRDTKQHFPKQWDAQIAPIAARVAQLRGLDFEHPVKVEYLSAAEFQKQVTESPADLKKQKDRIEQANAVFRATGLIGANVDLGQAANATQAADVIALYDYEKKKILVRGTGPFTVETRVTLAHELTHVLQDQHFDLTKLYKNADDSKTGSSDALEGLVEGDAERIEHKYLGEQSAADRAEYDRLSNATANAAGAQGKDLPPVVETYFDAPYVYGPQVVSILESTGGNRAIDAALTGATPTTRIYLDPTAVNQVATTPPPVPPLQPGEKKLSTETAQDEQFDDFSMYLMLAARLDAVTALRAADAWAAGSMTAYTTTDGTTCIRASVAGVNPASDAFLAQVFRRWTRTMPNAQVESTSSPVTFHSCDPGKRAVEPSTAAIRAAASLAADRGSMEQTFITTNHLENDLASCAARVMMQNPQFRAIVHEQTRAAFDVAVRAGAEAGAACRANPLAGIP